MSEDREALALCIVDFLRRIGLNVELCELPDGSFLPGARIRHGGLQVDLAKLQWPGDLLHEAGHLAVVPTAVRATLDDALQDMPAVQHGGEIEATAWAWAALRHLGLASSVLFHDGGYHGHSAGLRMNFELGVYLGASGLASAGMAYLAGHADTPAGAAVYPQMRVWLRA